MRRKLLTLCAVFCLAVPAFAADTDDAAEGCCPSCESSDGDKSGACDELAAAVKNLTAAEKGFRAYGFVERSKLEGMVRTIPALQRGSLAMADSYGAVAAVLESTATKHRLGEAADAKALASLDALAGLYRALEGTLLARLDAPARPAAKPAATIEEADKRMGEAKKALDAAKRSLIEAETERGAMTPVAKQRGREALTRLNTEFPMFDDAVSKARTLAAATLGSIEAKDAATTLAAELVDRAGKLAERLTEAPPEPVLQAPT